MITNDDGIRFTSAVTTIANSTIPTFVTFLATTAFEDNNDILSLIDCMFNSYNKDALTYSSISNLNRNTNYKIPAFKPQSKDISARVIDLIKYYDTFMVLKPKTRDIYQLIHINEYDQEFNKKQKTVYGFMRHQLVR